MQSEFPRVEVESRAAWRSWLEAHHDRSTSIWLVTYRKGDPRHVSYDAVVEDALCFGWIDSLPRKLDACRTMLLLSPRRPRSAWSKANKDRAERLVALGLMAPSGLACVEAARRDGFWTKLDAVEALTIPEDLAGAFEARQTARSHWDTFPRSVRRGILEWIVSAKRPETRARRIAETVEAAASNRRANQWRPPAVR